MADPDASHAADLRFSTVSRRSLLLAGAGIVVSTVATSCQSGPAGTSPTARSAATIAPADPAQVRPVLSALHVHASFSEGPGSMQAQLAQAERQGYEVLWWTEHDWRMAGYGYLSHLGVDDSLADSPTWRPDETNTGEHRLTHDAPARRGSGPTTALWLRTSDSTGDRSAHRLFADSKRHLYRTSLHGQVWTVPIHPEDLTSGVVGLDLRTSWRPGTGGLEEGFYWLCYRFGNQNSELIVRERRAEIRLPAPVGTWTELTLRPADDFSAAWPHLDGRDASCVEASVIVEAQPGGSAAGYFANIAIDRTGLEGDAPLVTHRDLMKRYTTTYPTVRQWQGLEISQTNPHVCWYGGTPQIPPVTKGSPLSLAGQIRAGGGVTSYAHPFGVDSQPADSPLQLELAAAALETLLASSIHDCDALEVGYRHRGGATLDTHESLWDALSRQGVFLTALGVNDDHVGRDWAAPPNNFGSWLWTSSTAEGDLLGALRSGRVYFGDPTLFSGQLDIVPTVGGHMGMAVIGPDAMSEVRLVARGVPDGSSLELLRIEMMQNAAPMDPAELVTVTVPAADLVAGFVTASVDTVTACLVRTRVRDGSGAVIALSNPVWFILDEATYPVPEHRRIQPRQ